ncbi:MAG: hypothetical protein QXW47_02970 [Candidatus Jordarchaeales archaeon]
MFIIPILIAPLSASFLVSIGNPSMPLTVNTENFQTLNQLNTFLTQAVQKSTPDPDSIKQQTINIKAVTVYNAYISWSESVDRDGDGYYSVIRLYWDVDTTRSSDYVRVIVRYRTDDGSTGAIYSDWYYTYGSSSDYHYMDLIASDRLTVSFRLDVQTSSGDSYTGYYGMFGLSNIHMESEEQDKQNPLVTLVIFLFFFNMYNQQRSSMTLLIIVGVVVAVVVVVVVVAVILATRKPKAPLPPSVPPYSGPSSPIPPPPSPPGEPESSSFSYDSKETDASKTITCPKCGYVNASYSDYCIKCGSILPKE